jgi:uncharacterized protein
MPMGKAKNRKTNRMSKAKDELDVLSNDRRIIALAAFPHHCRFTAFEHVVSVAKLSLKLARLLPGRFDLESTVRGAMLHDYYFYDWRDKEQWHHGHLKKHPKIAYVNACRDFGDLNPTEKDIILHHMWPHPLSAMPRSKEAWIVSFADKMISLKEAFSFGRKRMENKWRHGKKAMAS